MKKLILCITLSLLSSIALGGEALSPFEKLCHKAVSDHATPAGKKLTHFLKDYWDYRMKEFPEEATWNGYPGQNDRLTDYSSAAIARRQREFLAINQVIRSIDPKKLSPSERVSYEVFDYDLQSEIESYKFPKDVFQISQMDGIHIDPPQLFSAMPTQTEEDFKTLNLRLKALPLRVEQAIALLKEGLKKGVTPPKITLRDVADQIKALIIEDGGEIGQNGDAILKSPLLVAYAKMPESMPKETQARLKKEAIAIYTASIRPVYKTLLQFFTDEYLPKAREATAWSALPQGAEWYALAVKRNTTTSMTPQQIHDLGLSEVKRIRAAMEETVKASGFKGSFAEFSKFLGTDEQFYPKSREEILKESRDIAKRIDPELTKLFGKLPRLTYGVSPVPEFSEKSQAGGYYEPGSLSAGRPGVIYINTYDLKSRPFWGLETLIAHEAVPGHHLQTALAAEIEGVPEFRKYNWYTAYGEGWALYSESLGSEIGLYKSPYSMFGHLSDEMLRAIRLVVDTGMHSLGWSRDKAIAFFKEYSPGPEHEMIVETDRYLVWPGQALGYKIGQLKIKELRERWTKELGEKFDLRSFHDVVLANGNVPLAVLEKEVERWAQGILKAKKPVKKLAS